VLYGVVAVYDPWVCCGSLEGMEAAAAIPETKPSVRIFRDVSGYMAGQGGLLLLGFLTFPLFTRMLSRADYGAMSLINTSLSLLLLVFGLGLPNAVVRFFPQYSSGADNLYSRFNTTQLGGSILFAAAGSTMLFAASFFVHPDAQNASLVKGFRCVMFVLISRAAMNILLEFFRVGRRVALYNTLTLFQRLSTCGGALAGFFWFRNLNGLLGGICVAETIVAAFAAMLAYRSHYFTLSSLDMQQLWESVKFAVPLMLASLAGSIMAYADRYLIEAYLGREAVAMYAVAYDLCSYIQILLLTSFRLGVLPELVSRYASHGTEAASEFLSRSFRYMGWLVMGSAFGFAAIGDRAITVLASDKYADAGALLPYLIPGVMLAGLDFVFATGLYLRKRNDLWFYIASAAAMLNIGLNVLLIPAFGIKGAAYATLVGYIAQEIAVYTVSTRFIKLRFDGGSLLRALACGAVMFFVVKRIDLPHGAIAGLIVAVAGGVVLYGGLLLAFEGDFRQLLWGARD
jgi:O-antigen/teichoic acid export membrane protein